MLLDKVYLVNDGIHTLESGSLETLSPHRQSRIKIYVTACHTVAALLMSADAEP